MPALPVLDEEDEVGYRLGNWSEQARARLIVALIRANVEHRFDEEELVVATADEAKVDDLLEELQTVLAAEGVEVVVEEEDDEEDADDEAEDAEDEVGEGEADGDVEGEGDEGEEDDQPEAAPIEVAVEAPTLSSEEQGSGEPEPLDPTQAAIELLYDAAKRLRSDPTDMQADGDVAEASAGVFADEDLIGIDPDTWAAIGRVTRRLLGALGAEEALDDEIRTQAGVLAKLLQPYVEPDGPEGAIPATSTTAELLAESTAAVPEGRFDPGRAQDEGPDDDDEAEGDDEGGDVEDDDEEGLDEEGLAEEGLDEDGLEEGDEADEDGVEEGDEADEDDDEEADDEGEASGGDAADADSYEDAEIVYELPDWLPEQRANLSVMLDEADVAHAWDGGDLVIAGHLEATVDAIFDRIEDQEPVEDGGEERYRAIEDLFASANRLAGDPESPSRRDDFRAAFEATEGPAPLGMPDTLWWQIRARARTLSDDLSTGVSDKRVREDAVALRDLLRAVV